MNKVLVALFSGIVFGLGLCISEMVNPKRVTGFLDIFGNWDATLLFVMVAAIVITGTGFPLVTKRAKPIFADRFALPERTDIDLRLIAGSVLFGVGWGLAGLCPGPAIAALASLSPSVAVFVIAMLVGQWLASRFAG